MDAHTDAKVVLTKLHGILIMAGTSQTIQSKKSLIPLPQTMLLLGGEPFEHSNQQGLLPLLREVRRIYPDLSIWCFTGYLFDKDIVEKMCNEWKETKEMLQYIDVIVDGKYEEDKKDMMLQFKGSSNQRTILVKESLESGNVVLLYD